MQAAVSLTLRQNHLDRLRSLVLPADGREGAALLLCGSATIARDPWSGHPSVRYLSRDVVAIEPEDLVSASGVHVTVRTGTLVKVLRRARDENLVAGFVHSHPLGRAAFSKQDDQHEPLMAELARNRNGRSTAFLSLLTTQEGALAGRVWSEEPCARSLDVIHVVGDRFSPHYAGRFAEETPAAFHRQALAFGPALMKDLSALRIGVVGAGATGSATILLLARLGARRVAVFDRDVVDETNLSRMHGASRKDIGRPKVEVIKAHVEAFGLEAEIAAFQSWIGDPVCHDGLRSCDVIFGCTDDNDGRLLINRFAYYYVTPVIDMGIDIGLGDHFILGADARVTTIQPGTHCLLCRNIVDPDRAFAEHLERTDPSEYKRRVRERYVRGAGNPNPAVVHFTTDVATIAVDELIHRLTGYRRVGAAAHRVRKFHLLADKTPGTAARVDCPICGIDECWGRGDVQPFLDRVG